MRKQTVKNAAASIAQVILSGVLLFVLYRAVVNTIGLEALGIWSIVLASTSVSRIGELGLVGAVVPFVAKYISRSDESTAQDIVQVATLCVGVTFAILGLAAFPVLRAVLKWTLSSETLPSALPLLPYTIVSLWLTVVGGVFLSGLDGCQRIDLRALVVSISGISYVILSILLLPVHGLMGLAFAQVSQSFLALTLALFLLRRQLKGLPLLPLTWNPKLFRELFGYGVNLQVIRASQLVYAPVTKALLANFGGLELTGYYEMASRMVMKLRAVLVTANQVVVPTFAHLKESSPLRIAEFYEGTYRVLWYFSVPFYGAIVASSPLVSEVWLGGQRTPFILFAFLLTLGWFVNSLANPAYFANLGIGCLKWNTIGHLAIGVTNLLLGVLLGFAWGGVAVVVAWIVSLTIGSLIILVSYHLSADFPLKKWIPLENGWLGLATLAGLALAFGAEMCYPEELGSRARAVISLLLYLASVSLPFWQHPARRSVQTWIASSLPKPVKS